MNKLVEEIIKPISTKTGRKKKLKLIQISLIVSGFLIIFLTYLTDNNSSKEQIISKKTQELIKSQSLKNKSIDGDIFFNIE